MYEKLNILAKTLVAKLAKPQDEMADEGTLSRLKQVADRFERKQTDDELDADGYFAGRIAHRLTEELDLDQAKTHWKPETYQKQEIRRGEQLAGAAQCFEIDPMRKLPD